MMKKIIYFECLLCFAAVNIFATFPEKADSFSAIKLSNILIEEAESKDCWSNFKSCFENSNDSGKIKLAAAAETAISKLVKRYSMKDDKVVKCIEILKSINLNVTENQKGTKYYVNYTATSVQPPKKESSSKGSIK